MNDKQERLVNYVRELHQRDKRGPGDFPIQPAKKTVGSIGDLSFRKIASSMRTSVAGLMQAGSLRSELMIEDNAPPPTAVVAPPQGPHIPSLTQQAAVAYERALLEKPLSAADLIQLESIVLPALRPVFDIQNETYDNLPANWEPFNDQRSAIEPLIRGIGRLQLTGHPSYTYVGTGFVCGHNVILTNWHVAQIFVQGIANGLKLSYLPGISCAMEMLGEVGSASTLQLDVAQPIAALPEWDVALLRVEALPTGVVPLPLASSAPTAISGGFATVIGYPSYDPYESFVDQANIFRAVFDKKRFQPGKLNGCADVPCFGRNISAIAHDCSTLGGNSGSALISADTAQVVGIHFSGITHVSNYAIPTWELTSVSAFHGIEMNFS